MEETNEFYKEPKYTMRWLGLHVIDKTSSDK